ncbi:hypothetical protein O6H91_22G058700 [Diphasiastrum complanatum]|uniref:Uncharacterized protein n=1 Tax=Diphasiastrum complanatum TaxID=34168 RepID=A0ACC2AFX1_DIPCM|nr:hypothetical protein O6H91_22G058700 [Diphasiastrum complanatum]
MRILLLWQEVSVANFCYLFLAQCRMELPSAADIPTYHVGFLSPSPDSAIPAQLAVEWNSAFLVALEVLNSERNSYQLEAVSLNSACDYQEAALASMKLSKKSGLIGVIGPACSGAAISASNTLLSYGIPIVSFAATASVLSSRSLFGNFFRTVYSDTYQASAVAASVVKLNMTNVTLLYTKDYYSFSLAERIGELCGSAITRSELLEPGVNIPIDIKQLETVLNSIERKEIVLLVVQPAVAEQIWKTATDLNMTGYPWWYFGTDGTTAFEPAVAEGKVAERLVVALQGEIGLAPFDGDFSDSSACQKFYTHWKEKSYAGLPATDTNKSRSYVPYLIDTVTLFFEIVDALHGAAIEVNASTILAALNGSGPGSPQFKGCTGVVQLDPDSGSRSVSPNQPAVYNLVSLLQDHWELKGRIENGTFTTLLPLTRPGTFSAAEQDLVTSDSILPSRSENRVLIATITILFTSVVLVAAALLYIHKKRRNAAKVYVELVQESH